MPDAHKSPDEGMESPMIQSELALMREQQSRNAKNADYKAMLNARIAVKRTIDWIQANDQEQEQMLKAAMAEAASRRRHLRQDHDSKMADFDNGTRLKRTSVPIKTFLDDITATNRRNAVRGIGHTKSPDRLDISTHGHGISRPKRNTQHLEPSLCSQSLDKTNQLSAMAESEDGPGLSTASLEPKSKKRKDHGTSLRSDGKRTTAQGIEAHLEALGQVLSKLNSQLSYQHGSRPEDSPPQSVVVYYSGHLSAEMQSVKQAAKVENNATTTAAICQLACPRLVATALGRLQDATDALVAKAREKGLDDEAIGSEAAEAKSAMGFLIDILDDQKQGS